MIDKLEEAEFLTGVLEFFNKGLFCSTFRAVKCYLAISQSPIFPGVFIFLRAKSMTGGFLTSISKVVDKSEVIKLEAIVTAFKSFEENRVEKLEKTCDTTA